MRWEKRNFLHPLHLRKNQFDKLNPEVLYHSKNHESHWKRLQQKYNHNHYKYLTNMKDPPLHFGTLILQVGHSYIPMASSWNFCNTSLVSPTTTAFSTSDSETAADEQ